MHRALLILVVASQAWATDNFPAVIQAKYGLAAPPDCSLCHVNGIVGAGTVNTPFGRSMRMEGLLPSDEATLQTALDALEASSKDSDGDTLPDIAELKGGTNPNVKDTVGVDGGVTQEPVKMLPPVRFGCGADVVPYLVVIGALVPLIHKRRIRRKLL